MMMTIMMRELTSTAVVINTEYIDIKTLDRTTLNIFDDLENRKTTVYCSVQKILFLIILSVILYINSSILSIHPTTIYTV